MISTRSNGPIGHPTHKSRCYNTLTLQVHVYTQTHTHTRIYMNPYTCYVMICSGPYGRLTIMVSILVK